MKSYNEVVLLLLLSDEIREEICRSNEMNSSQHNERSISLHYLNLKLLGAASVGGLLPGALLSTWCLTWKLPGGGASVEEVGH